MDTTTAPGTKAAVARRNHDSSSGNDAEMDVMEAFGNFVLNVKVLGSEGAYFGCNVRLGFWEGFASHHVAHGGFVKCYLPWREMNERHLFLTFLSFVLPLFLFFILVYFSWRRSADPSRANSSDCGVRR